MKGGGQTDPPPTPSGKTTLKTPSLIRVKESLLIKLEQPQLNKTIKSFSLKLFQ